MLISIKKIFVNILLINLLFFLNIVYSYYGIVYLLDISEKNIEKFYIIENILFFATLFSLCLFSIITIFILFKKNFNIKHIFLNIVIVIISIFFIYCYKLILNPNIDYVNFVIPIIIGMITSLFLKNEITNKNLDLHKVNLDDLSLISIFNSKNDVYINIKLNNDYLLKFTDVLHIYKNILNNESNLKYKLNILKQLNLFDIKKDFKLFYKIYIISFLFSIREKRKYNPTNFYDFLISSNYIFETIGIKKPFKYKDINRYKYLVENKITKKIYDKDKIKFSNMETLSKECNAKYISYFKNNFILTSLILLVFSIFKISELNYMCLEIKNIFEILKFFIEYIFLVYVTYLIHLKLYRISDFNVKENKIANRSGCNFNKLKFKSYINIFKNKLYFYIYIFDNWISELFTIKMFDVDIVLLIKYIRLSILFILIFIYYFFNLNIFLIIMLTLLLNFDSIFILKILYYKFKGYTYKIKNNFLNYYFMKISSIKTKKQYIVNYILSIVMVLIYYFLF